MTKSPLNKFKLALKVEGHPSIGQVLRRRRRTLKDYIREQGVETGAQVIPYLENLLQSVREFSYEEDFFEALPSLVEPAPPVQQALEESPVVVEPTKSSTENKKKKSKADTLGTETPPVEESHEPNNS